MLVNVLCLILMFWRFITRHKFYFSFKTNVSRKWSDLSPGIRVHLCNYPCGIKLLILGSTDILLDFEEICRNTRGNIVKCYLFL
jgi:hypothetical protein